MVTCSHCHGYHNIWQVLEEWQPRNVSNCQTQGSSRHEQGEYETSSEAGVDSHTDSDQLHHCYDQQQLRGVVVLLEGLKPPDSAFRPNVWKGS